jgi:hypothetical protein
MTAGAAAWTHPNAIENAHVHDSPAPIDRRDPRAVSGRVADFGPGRSKIFGNSAGEYLKVHQFGSSQADVTEGSGGVWERLRYDWSNPDRVVLTTTDSNVWGGLSGHTYTFTRRQDGLTDVDVVVVREGKNWKGRVLGFVLGTIGRRVLEKAFENSITAIGSRNRSLPSGNPASRRLPPTPLSAVGS